MNIQNTYETIKLLMYMFKNKKDFLYKGYYPIFDNSKYLQFLIDNELINKIENLKYNKSYTANKYIDNKKYWVFEKPIKHIYFIELNEINIIKWIKKNSLTLDLNDFN